MNILKLFFCMFLTVVIDLVIAIGVSVYIGQVVELDTIAIVFVALFNDFVMMHLYDKIGVDKRPDDFFDKVADYTIKLNDEYENEIINITTKIYKNMDISVVAIFVDEIVLEIKIPQKSKYLSDYETFKKYFETELYFEKLRRS